MKWKQQNQAVYKAISPIVSIKHDDIDMLKKAVHLTPEKRIRICAHQEGHDPLHEMMIVLTKGTYIRPHKHILKSESFHMIEGIMDVVIFDDQGLIIDIISMGKDPLKHSFFYRLSVPYYHTLILRTDMVVFHETTNGPFLKEDTLFPDWAPEQTEENACLEFMKNLEKKVNFYKTS